MGRRYRARRLRAVIKSRAWIAVCIGVACGGLDRGRPGESVSATPPTDDGGAPTLCDAAQHVALGPIEDFELGAAANGWFANNDVCAACQGLVAASAELDACRAACVASQSPHSFDAPLPAERIAPARCGSSYAIHCRTAALSGWGGNLGARFSPPLDGHLWTGISFWARRGASGRNALRVELSDRSTDEESAGRDGAATCAPNPSPDVLETGCDKYGAHIVLDEDWHLFLLPFAELDQAGWGKPAPVLDLTALWSLRYSYGPGTWDYWLDDVALYRD